MCKRLLVVTLIVFGAVLSAQQALNNEGVIKLIKAGLSDDLVISTINASPASFDTSADGIIALKTNGASEKVIAAILQKSSNKASGMSSEQTSALHNSEMSNNDSSAASSGAPEVGAVTASGRIPSGARIVIAPMGGFETYFAAAVREKKVPITLTLDKASAQYFVVSTNTEWQGFVYGSGGSASWTRAGGSAAYGSAASSTRGLEASIMLIDAKTKDIVWAYEVHKNSHGGLLFGTLAARGQQSIAEACAKHLKDYIEKGK